MRLTNMVYWMVPWASYTDGIPMYEVFEHTADLGIRVRAPTVDQLFAESAKALFSIIVGDLGRVSPKLSIPLAIPGRELDFLLLDWLSELLYQFHTDHLLFCQFLPVVACEGLTATMQGEPLDLERHRLETEIKAVTYHQLKVEQVGAQWLAEFIVDI